MSKILRVLSELEIRNLVAYKDSVSSRNLDNVLRRKPDALMKHVAKTAADAAPRPSGDARPSTQATSSKEK